jgi:ssDNA-binding Zn-finger/Zn-ribbon topoisomerase 1
MAIKYWQCPNCGEYKMRSKRSRLLTLGWIGLALTFVFLFLVITIPLAPVALIACLGGFIGAIFVKGARCEKCNYVNNYDYPKA